MNLEEKECYTAVLNRDVRYDGRFVTCVLTTGIYCRPICPARTPKLQNVKFHHCAAAAEEEGFRPCKRCSPESSPGLPAWLGTSAIVRRALRLIGNGDLDNQSVEEFSARLGVTDRHLRRLFVEHLGCSPGQVARTRRLHFARKLLVETQLSISQVSLSSGFSSERRFRSAFSTTFQLSPKQFREKFQRRLPKESSCYKLTIPVRLPYHWESFWDYLKYREAGEYEEIESGFYRRTFKEFGEAGVLEISFDSNVAIVKVFHPDPQVLFSVSTKAKHFLDSDSCPTTVENVLASSSKLADSTKKWPGLRVPGCWDGLELAVRAIVGQQVSVKGATTIVARIANTFGEPFSDSRFTGLSRLFPSAMELQSAKLEECGLIKSRANAIRELATKVVEQKIQLDPSADVAQTLEQLTEIRGIGPWTANYIALRVLRDPDAFPGSDLVLRKSASDSADEPLDAKTLQEMSLNWKPFRAYAAMHLWKCS